MQVAFLLLAVYDTSLCTTVQYHYYYYFMICNTAIPLCIYYYSRRSSLNDYGLLLATLFLENSLQTGSERPFCLHPRGHTQSDTQNHAILPEPGGTWSSIYLSSTSLLQRQFCLDILLITIRCRRGGRVHTVEQVLSAIYKYKIDQNSFEQYKHNLQNLLGCPEQLNR